MHSLFFFLLCPLSVLAMNEAENGNNIWTAASDGDLERVKAYIDSGAHAINAQDAQGYSPLAAAASYGHVEMVQWLLDNGADVNIKDNDGDRPLHHCEDPAMAQMLITGGADVHAVNNENQTPQQAAEENEDLNMALFFSGVTGVEVRRIEDNADAENEGLMSTAEE